MNDKDIDVVILLYWKRYSPYFYLSVMILHNFWYCSKLWTKIIYLVIRKMSSKKKILLQYANICIFIHFCKHSITCNHKLEVQRSVLIGNYLRYFPFFHEQVGYWSSTVSPSGLLPGWLLSITWCLCSCIQKRIYLR